MWNLEEGLSLIRALQPHAHILNYSLALGGSVLNNGESNKDLDIIAIPFHGKKATPNEIDLIALFEKNLGCVAEDWHKDYDEEETQLKFDRLLVFQFHINSTFQTIFKRVDLFIINK